MGNPVACMSYGSFSDYQLIPAKQAMPVPVVAPEIVALLTSGLTASIGELFVGSVLAGCHARSGSCKDGLSFSRGPTSTAEQLPMQQQGLNPGEH